MISNRALANSHPISAPSDAATAVHTRDDAAPSGLAALLDRFSASVLEPESHTVGDFATAVQSLHSELALLARHFGADDALLADALNFDDTESAGPCPADVEAYAGIAASEDLEHACRLLSR
jgi:hypothetical protein